MSYGIGIVGTGSVAELHARAIADAEGVHLSSVLSRSPERAAAFAARHGCTGYADAGQFVRDERTQIVSVCTPPGTHVAPSLQAIAAGKHLIIEKPLEITLDGCDAIIEAAAVKGVRVGGIFQSRFHDSAGALKKAVDEGRFGRLVLGDARVKWFRSQEYYDKGGWKGQRRFGGGALMNQAIHAIDLLQWCMGPVEQVQAITRTLGHERLDVEDTAVAILRFASGACGVIEATTASYPGFLKSIEISGTRGSARLEEEDVKFWQFDPERDEDARIRADFAHATGTAGGASDPMAIGSHGHRRQFEEFAEALREDRRPMVDAEEARKAVAIILALYDSAETGKPVFMAPRRGAGE